MIGVGVVAAAAFRLAEAIKASRQASKRMLIGGITAVLLIAYGMLGFFGAFLSATGHPPSTNTEVPMGRVDDAVTDRDGLIYCPSTPWGRIQLYDRDKRFIRGWSVHASGGVFRIHVDAENHLEVATARRRMLYVFDRDGNLLSGKSYEPRGYSDFNNWRGTVVWIPTAFYLLPMASPFFAWAVAVVGMILLTTVTRKPRRAPIG